jgi:ATP-dependent helicase YprA (DUF1998 family)
MERSEMNQSVDENFNISNSIVSSVLSHWVLPYFAVASAPFETCLLEKRLPIDHISTLEDPDKIDALCACLIVYALTSTKIIPRTFQPQASIATLNGRDTIITAGTGCGKTLCLLIPMLLRPNTIPLTISPLKRLQTTQANNPVRYSHASAA